MVACAFAGCSGSSSSKPSDAAVEVERDAAPMLDAVGQDADAALPGLALPSPIFGVTVDDTSNIVAITGALAAFTRKPTVRIVFNQGQPPSAYATAVPAIHDVAFTMGELLDSEFVPSLTTAAYVERTRAYLAAFGTQIDLWEIGNEINGEWLGTAADVEAKMTGAFDVVRAAGKHTALTLYGCSDTLPQYDMFNWIAAHVPARMRTGLDYVFVSYYEGDCGSPRNDWPAVFTQLHALFPNAGLGFGEAGFVNANGVSQTAADPAGAARYAQKYYRLAISTPNYVVGGFWWYFVDDATPKSKPFWAVLNAL